MRITGNRLIENTAEATARQQSRVAETSDQVSSGMRVGKPSDDPNAWLAAQRAKVHRVMSDGITGAVGAQRDRLDETEGALAAIGDVMNQVRGIVVQANNASLNAADRAALGDQVKGLFIVALGAANRRSTDGEYLLAGTNSLAQPFDASGVYTGDGTAREVAVTEDSTTASTIAGSALTASGPGTVDVLPLLDRVATALKTNDTATLATLVDQMKLGVDQVAGARSHVGSVMNVLDATKQAHAALRDNLTTAIARNVEVDSIAAASDLAKASQALEVSRAVSAHIIALLSSQTSG